MVSYLVEMFTIHCVSVNTCCQNYLIFDSSTWETCTVRLLGDVGSLSPGLRLLPLRAAFAPTGAFGPTSFNFLFLSAQQFVTDNCLLATWANSHRRDTHTRLLFQEQDVVLGVLRQVFKTGDV